MATAQEIRFCTSSGGTAIAYATAGEGPALPLVRTATWMTHLEHDREIYSHWFEDLARDRRYVRYDHRGCGLSDRDVADVSFEAAVADLESVVDAAGLDRFDLLGVSGGGPVAVAYAVKHPWRVAHLVLFGAYLQGGARRSSTPGQVEEQRLLVDMTRVGWGRPDPLFRSVFAQRYMPDADRATIDAYDRMQRVSADADMASRLRETWGDVDITALASRVRVPTLVMHVREDGAVPFEEGRKLAAAIPGARFVPLPGRNHVIGPDGPAWPELVRQLHEFCRSPQPQEEPLPELTSRETDVLALIASGLDNADIADRLQLSPRTIERHVSNIYLKLSLSGPSARAAAAARYTRAR